VSHGYAVIDVETSLFKDGEVPRTKFWGYADERGYRSFKTTAEMWKWLRGQEPRVLLHHSNFDVLMLLVDGAKDLDIQRSHNGKLIRCSWGYHLLQNSYAVFPVALREIFKAFGHKKTDLGNLKKRNYDDCVLALECFLALDGLFSRVVGVSPLETGTVAGTTFKAAELHAGKMPKDLRFVEAYRGGRVEVYDTREYTASKFDIHSSYPRSFLESPASDDLLCLSVNTKDWHCPFFQADRLDMLIFPNGEFLTWMYRSNFEKYVEPYMSKTKVRVINKTKINLTWLTELKDLIEKIYKLKQETKNAAEKLCAKFLLNAFYGRIGLKGESERVRILDYEIDGEDISTYPLRGGKFMVFDNIQMEPRSNYPFAAYITDNARCRLYRGLVRNRPLYGDTDSIVTRRGKSTFTETLSEACGDWGYEGREKFQARNVKDYTWGKEQKLKGGTGYISFTLKDFAKGKGVVEQSRTRKTELQKRTLLPNGETCPLVVE
jgi:hypothetical protein